MPRNQHPIRHWWTRDEKRQTVVLVQDGAAGISVAEVPDPWIFTGEQPAPSLEVA